MNIALNKEFSKPVDRPLRLALIFDEPAPLSNFGSIIFPEDATAEWESHKTLLHMEKTWNDLGYQTVLLPLDKNFLSRWANIRSSVDLVHSVVEGWGSASREGWIPSLCELSGVPFIGAGPAAQNIAMKKSLIKLVCNSLKIPTPEFYLIRHISEIQNVPEMFLQRKHFIKPDAEGSGLGIDEADSVSNSKLQTERQVERLLLKFPDGVILEKYLPGSEFTSAIIGSKSTFLPIAQVQVDSGVYGLANKSKEFMGEKISFPDLPAPVCKVIQEGTHKLWHYLGLHDFVRMDWKMDQSGNIFFLEANPLAGLSYFYSVLPKMAEKAGINYGGLLEALAHSALCRSHDRCLWYGKARVL